jgi:hypothetical protein
MEEQLISFETAVLAKEKGFTMFKENFKSTLVDSRNYDVQRYSFYRVINNEQTINLNVGTNSSTINGLWESYNDENFVIQKNYFAPTQTLLQKWLREVYGIHIQPFYHPNTISTREIKPEVEIVRVFAKDGITKSILPPSLRNEEFDTYEQAFEEGLLAALKLIK